MAIIENSVGSAPIANLQPESFNNPSAVFPAPVSSRWEFDHRETEQTRGPPWAGMGAYSDPGNHTDQIMRALYCPPPLTDIDLGTLEQDRRREGLGESLPDANILDIDATSDLPVEPQPEVQLVLASSFGASAPATRATSRSYPA